MKTIGILTSGGDSPGMNAAIRAVVRCAKINGIKVIGIKNGYNGLVNDDMKELHSEDVADILQRGGTILGTARCLEFKNDENVRKQAVEILKKHGIEGLVVIGGDGSYRGAQKLSQLGIKTVGIPGTIDNDMGYTDYTIGFFTSTQTAVDAIEKLRDTSSSHKRVSIVEVMGRDCGDIALYSGIAGGSESIIVPEIKFTEDDIVAEVLKGKKRGKTHHIIVIAEGVDYDAKHLENKIETETGRETRVTTIGHVQRGGSPCVFDRILASRMGEKAIDCLIKGETNIAIALKGNDVVEVPIDDAVAKREVIDKNLYELSKKLSV